MSGLPVFRVVSEGNPCHVVLEPAENKIAEMNL